jgi:hypothetical protein
MPPGKRCEAISAYVSQRGGRHVNIHCCRAGSGTQRAPDVDRSNKVSMLSDLDGPRSSTARECAKLHSVRIAVRASGTHLFLQLLDDQATDPSPSAINKNFLVAHGWRVVRRGGMRCRSGHSDPGVRVNVAADDDLQ